MQLLADIWWTNHRLREHSVIQSLFTGQYKSVMTCGCGRYSSSRFEPFTYLTLPVPEDNQLVMSVYIIGDKLPHTTVCSVRVGGEDDVRALVNKVCDLNIPNVDRTSEYAIALTLNSAVVNFYPYDKKLSTFRDTDSLVMFQLARAPIIVTSQIDHTAGVSTSPLLGNSIASSVLADSKSAASSRGVEAKGRDLGEKGDLSPRERVRTLSISDRYPPFDWNSVLQVSNKGSIQVCRSLIFMTSPSPISS